MDIGTGVLIAAVSVAVTAVVAALVARAWAKKIAQQTASEEEIRDMVTESAELQEDEKSMIHEIIELGDMRAYEVMQPRVDMMFVQDTEPVRAALDRMMGTGYSRLPVYHDDFDQVTGIVHYKDLMPAVLDGQEDHPVGRYSYEPLYVPETKDVIPLLSEMQNCHQQMAIVVDEYGGTAGVLTVEDIVEEIVGEIVDETDREGGYLRVVRRDEWVADGRLPVDEAASLGWPVEESDDYETIAGWLLSKATSVPQTGDCLTFGGYTFKIEGMRRRRIQRVRVRKVAGEEPAEKR